MRTCDSCRYGEDGKHGGIKCLNRKSENYGLWVGYTGCCDEWKKRIGGDAVSDIGEQVYEREAEAVDVEVKVDENVSKDFLEGCFTIAEAIAKMLHDEADAEAVRALAEKWRVEWKNM